MRSWRMGSCEIADSVSLLLCTKATFHSLGKIHRGPSWRSGLPQDSCLLSSRLGGQDWLTQMPPFLRHTDLKLAAWRNESLCVGPTGKVHGIFLHHFDCNRSSCFMQLFWCGDTLTQPKTQPLNFRLKKTKRPSTRIPIIFLSLTSLGGVRIRNGIGVIRFFLQIDDFKTCFTLWQNRSEHQEGGIRVVTFKHPAAHLAPLLPPSMAPFFSYCLPCWFLSQPQHTLCRDRHPFFWASDSNSCSVHAYLTNRIKCAYIQLGLSHISEKQRW